MQTKCEVAKQCVVYFRDEQKTGIAPTRIILDKQLEITVGMVVTVNWDGEKVEAEIP